MSGITVWTYKPVEQGGNMERDGQRFLFSGIGTARLEGQWGILENWTNGVRKYGHAITVPNDYWPPWNHHIIGCGVSHDDAQFAETGSSMAAYYESGEAWGGHWWDVPGAGREYYHAPFGEK